jgi:hypothetical protein
MDFDWKGLVRTIAPTIGTVLSGGNPLVGMGIKAISSALLGKPDGSEDEVSMALQNASAEDLTKLRVADNTFKVEMKKLGLEGKKLAFDDADSARKREMAVKDKTPAILAYFLTVLFGTLLGVLIFGPELKEANKAIIFTLAGSLGTVWIAAMAYYHGSSRGSAEKNIILQGKK